MPKANANGATYYGVEGHVLDSHDRVSELDPSRNVDGTVVDNFESDERDMEDRPAGEYPAEVTSTERDDDEKSSNEDEPNSTRPDGDNESEDSGQSEKRTAGNDAKAVDAKDEATRSSRTRGKTGSGDK